MAQPYAWDSQAIRRKVATSLALSIVVFLAGCKVQVITYHYDNLRTGWNSLETHLNYSNVNSSSLSVLALQLDDKNDQVDTQPLIIPGMRIAGGKHDVVYVATENNNIYAIDANTDTKLLKVNLGPPVPMPLGCNNNGPTVGIDGTPVIDSVSKSMYVIAYVLDSSNTPEYFIHALDLASLTDKVPPRKVTASHNLGGGMPFPFNATYQRQRPGLLLANGNVYAAFGSFCDFFAAQSRGWVLGWQTGSLTPLPSNELNNTRTSAPNGWFLSSVWMSGYGLAGDTTGNLYFSTGNSDYSGTTYDGDTNIQESVVKLRSDITRPAPPAPFLFTPANVSSLDQGDLDVSSGGVMLLPSQSGPVSQMVVATAKDGSMFLLNQNNLGGFTPNDAGKLDKVNIGGACWCGPTYFSDGSPHIVSSGGTFQQGYTQNILQLWDLQTLPQPKLVRRASANMPDTIQDPGFFTTVSSKGPSNAIIWAVSRPLTNSEFPSVWLYAFKARPSGNTLPPLFQAVAGSWPYLTGNANIVPVVANGKVYVASYKELDIFGVHLHGGQKVESRKLALAQAPRAEFVKGPEEHQVSGTVRKVDGERFTIETRDKKTVEVDATKASQAFRYPVLAVGNGVVAAGSYEANGVLQAETVWRAKPAPASWPPDR